MSSESVIQVRNLSKCYEIYEKPQDRLLQMLSRGRKQFFKEFWALRDISFEVKQGETLALSAAMAVARVPYCRPLLERCTLQLVMYKYPVGYQLF